MRERFDALTAFTLHAGTPSGCRLSGEELELEILSRAEAERKQPVPAGFSVEDLENSRFALYAWVDERLLTSTRPDASLWAEHTLQQRYFGSSSAGIEFYQRLDELVTALADTTSNAPLDLSLSTPMPEVDLEKLPEKLVRNAVPAAIMPDAQHMATRKVLAVYAQSLLYGFRGQLFRTEHNTLLHEFRVASHTFLEALEHPAEKQHVQHSPGLRVLASARQTPRRKICNTLYPTLRMLEPALHRIVPLIICAGFYVYCATILSSLTLPD